MRQRWRWRATMAREVTAGHLCLTCWIVVTNAQGHHVLTLHFGEAIEIKEPPECGMKGPRPEDVVAEAARD